MIFFSGHPAGGRSTLEVNSSRSSSFLIIYASLTWQSISTLWEENKMLGHCSLMIMYLYSKSVIYLSECSATPWTRNSLVHSTLFLSEWGCNELYRVIAVVCCRTFNITWCRYANPEYNTLRNKQNINVCQIHQSFQQDTVIIVLMQQLHLLYLILRNSLFP